MVENQLNLLSFETLWILYINFAENDKLSLNQCKSPLHAPIVIVSKL